MKDDLLQVLSSVDPLGSAPLLGVHDLGLGAALALGSREAPTAAQPHIPAAVSSSRIRWARLAVPVAVVALVGTFTLTQRGGSVATADPATPQLLTFERGTHQAASVLLTRAAARAYAAPLTGPVLHRTTQSWAFSTDVDSRARAISQLLTTTREVWLKPDGSGRVDTTTAQTPVIAGEALHGKALDHQSTTVGPDFVNSNAGLPDNAAALLPVVQARSKQMGLSEDANVGAYILGNLAEGDATPRQEAAMLDLLAGVPSIFDAGVVTDRAGRRGFAVGLVTSSPTSPTVSTVYLIVDPETGRTLGEETVWTPNPPKGLHLRPGPLVASYQLFIVIEQTAAIPG